MSFPDAGFCGLAAGLLAVGLLACSIANALITARIFSAIAAASVSVVSGSSTTNSFPSLRAATSPRAQNVLADH
jgi:hypothetical protein